VARVLKNKRRSARKFRAKPRYSGLFMGLDALREKLDKWDRPHHSDGKTGWEGLDPGIAGAVKILMENGIETCQSCEGGSGHSYPEPTVDLLGGEGAGWKALGVCLENGLPVLELRRTWTLGASDRVPDGPIWQLVFREHVSLT
jgi:hypothetical protein